MNGIINISEIRELIKKEIPHVDVSYAESMKNHTSFRIGGDADIFVDVKKEDDIINSVSFFKKYNIPYTIIGNGSNLLVSDYGIEGAVICIGKSYTDIETDGEYVRASSGTLLSKIASVALENSLAGFEFASGIPGTLGGALVMNAGAYGGEMKDVTFETKYINSKGEICKVTGDEHMFSYRHSCFTKDDIILSSTLKLQKGDKDEIKELMQSLATKRREKQPLEYPSAGSTFKRPEGYFAAKLIDDANLRGFSVGGAKVSDKHCGFVINSDNATCRDVLNLMKHIRETVKDKFGVILEPEVRFLGRCMDVEI